MSASTSNSLAPGARSRPWASRSASGTALHRSSSERRPMNSSIDAISASVCGTKWATSARTHERSADDPARHVRAPHVDRDGGPGLEPGRHEPERDPVAQHRREVATRHVADDGTAGQHLTARPRRLAPLDGQPPQEPGHAPRPLGLEGAATTEVALAPPDDPTQARLQRGDPRPELVA